MPNPNSQGPRKRLDLKGALKETAFSGLLLLCVFSLLDQVFQFLSLQFHPRPMLKGVTVGQAFWVYYMGPQVLFQHGDNPYLNSSFLRLFKQGFLHSGHPNPLVDAIGMHFFRGGEMDGYVASPVNLWLLRPLSRIPYVWAFNGSVAIGGLALLAVIVLFTWKLSQGEGKARTLDHIFIFGLLLTGLSFSFWESLFWHGEIETLYVPLLGVGVYLYAFHAHRRSAVAASGFLLALASGIKVFPAILLGYFLWKAALELWESWKGRTATHGFFWSRPVFLMAVAFLTALLGIALLTIHEVGWRVVESWLTFKLPLLRGEAFPGDITMAEYPFLAYYLYAMQFVIPKLFNWHLVYKVIAVAVAGLTVCKLTSRDHGDFLPEVALLISALPIVLPRWLNSYNVVMSLVLVTSFFFARKLPQTGRRRAIEALLVAAFLSLNYGFIDVVSALHPSLRIDPYYTSAWGPNPVNAFMGFPGIALLYVANWLILCQKSERPWSTAHQARLSTTR